MKAAASKVCRLCGVDKPMREYNRSPDHSSGYRSECRLCGKAYHQRRRDGRAKPRAPVIRPPDILPMDFYPRPDKYFRGTE